MKSYRKNKIKESIYHKAWMKRNKKEQTFKRTLKNHGITKEYYEFMFTNQSGMCAICSSVLIDSKLTHIDHNHSTQKIRGLLCATCNLGLGHFKDSISLLSNAIKYLEPKNVVNA